MLARNKESESTRNSHTPVVAVKVPIKRVVPQEPSPLDFLTEIPSISALDYAVLRLTAKFVARNGRQFLLSLSQREMRNPQFDFLRPNHSLHNTFLKLVEQYTRILMPSKALLEKLDLYGYEKYKVIDLIMKRIEYTRYVREQHLKEEEIAERERIAFASIDWHDFVIAETIDFGPADRTMDLPRPLDYSSILSMSLVQRRELWNGNVMAGKASLNPADTGEEEMEVEEAHPINVKNHSFSAPTPKRPTITLPGTEGIRIREDYVPKAQAKTTSHQEQRVICPLCGLAYPTDEIAEHIRVESLDPKWKEQKDKHYAKHVETNIVTSGAEVAQNLRAMNIVRNELAGLRREDADRIISDANKMAAAGTVQYDGRSDPSSIGVATREALQKAKPILKAQMAELQKDQSSNTARRS